MNQAVSLFLDALVAERNASPHTVRAYAHDLGRFREWLASRLGTSDFGLDEIDRQHVRSFFGDLVSENPAISKGTLARMRSALKSFMTFAVQRGLIDHNQLFRIQSVKLERLLP